MAFSAFAPQTPDMPTVLQSKTLVDLDEASLNQLFDTLADWTTVLEAHQSANAVDEQLATTDAPEP